MENLTPADFVTRINNKPPLFHIPNAMLWMAAHPSIRVAVEKSENWRHLNQLAWELSILGELQMSWEQYREFRNTISNAAATAIADVTTDHLDGKITGDQHYERCMSHCLVMVSRLREYLLSIIVETEPTCVTS